MTILTNELCVSCLENNEQTIAECTVSQKASELWDLDVNDKYCWDCWDNIHWEYQDLARDGDCYCDLCNYNRDNLIRKVKINE